LLPLAWLPAARHNSHLPNTHHYQFPKRWRLLQHNASHQIIPWGRRYPEVMADLVICHHRNRVAWPQRPARTRMAL